MDVKITNDMQGIEIRTSRTPDIVRGVLKDWRLYLLLLPLVIWFWLFAYMPLSGLLVAFENYKAADGILGSDFVGFANFERILVGITADSFWGAFRNTFIISSYGLIFGFPVPIILALLFSDINNETYRKITQTIAYLPHFLSEVSITGIVLMLVSKNGDGANTSYGIVADILVNLGIAKPTLAVREDPALFRPMYLITGIWKESGYSSIVYFAAIMGISPVMYEALKVDGGNKWQEIRYVTVPGMAPTLIIMIIMRIGRMLSVGFERVLLLYHTNTYITADVLSTLEQRIGMGTEGKPGNSSLGSAIGMFNSVIGFALVVGANSISRQASKTSLW